MADDSVRWEVEVSDRVHDLYVNDTLVGWIVTSSNKVYVRGLSGNNTIFDNLQDAKDYLELHALLGIQGVDDGQL